MGLPARGKSGFGRVRVKGWVRVDLPAARIIPCTIYSRSLGLGEFVTIVSLISIG